MSNENLFNDIANAGSLTDYAPRLKVGDHALALNLYDTQNTREKGVMVFAELVVIESTAHRPGEVVGDAWFVGQNGLPGEYARKRALAFGQAIVSSLNGDPNNTPLVQQTLSQISDKVRQPGRGLVLRCSTREKTKTDKEGKTKTHVNNTWSPLEGQTPETIGQRRAWCEQVAPVQVRAAQPAYAQPAPMPQSYAAPPVQPTYAQQPAPAAFGFGQPQPAPTYAATPVQPQTYAQPAPAPQVANPGVAPGMGGLLGNFGIK